MTLPVASPRLLAAKPKVRPKSAAAAANMDLFKPAEELHNTKGLDGECLKGQVLKKCLDDLKKSKDIHCHNVCVDIIYKASFEYDKDLNWRDFAGLVIVSLIEELKGHTNHIRKLQGAMQNFVLKQGS